MRRALDDGLELDDDLGRVDLEAVHDFLTHSAYWAIGRSFAATERRVRASARVLGLYRAERQLGFSRTVSDGAIAYLADVYVLPEVRGRGLGLELVRESVERGPYARCRWLLHTADAHGLYARFGFEVPDRVLERPAPL